MCTGAHPAYMQTQVDRVFKEIGEHFDLASAMAVDGFAAVFGTVLERRAEGSRKRPRSDAIQASESPVTGLGVPSQDSGPREDAEKADVPSKSARAPPYHPGPPTHRRRKRKRSSSRCSRISRRHERRRARRPCATSSLSRPPHRSRGVVVARSRHK